MKRRWLVVACAACAPLAATSDASLDERVAAIERDLPHMRRDSGTVFGLSAEGATLDAAYVGDSLRRLRAEFLGETGRAEETYYFDERLLLVVRVDARYDRPLSGRVVDSTVLRFDLTRRDVRPAVLDSLATNARALLGLLAARDSSPDRDD